MRLVADLTAPASKAVRISDTALLLVIVLDILTELKKASRGQTRHTAVKLQKYNKHLQKYNLTR